MVGLVEGVGIFLMFNIVVLVVGFDYLRVGELVDVLFFEEVACTLVELVFGNVLLVLEVVVDYLYLVIFCAMLVDFD